MPKINKPNIAEIPRTETGCGLSIAVQITAKYKTAGLGNVPRLTRKKNRAPIRGPICILEFSFPLFAITEQVQ